MVLGNCNLTELDVDVTGRSILIQAIAVLENIMHHTDERPCSLV